MAGSSAEIQSIRQQLLHLAGTGGSIPAPIPHTDDLASIPAPVPYTDDLASLVQYARGLKLKTASPKDYAEDVANAFPLLQCANALAGFAQQKACPMIKHLKDALMDPEYELPGFR